MPDKTPAPQMPEFLAGLLDANKEIEEKFEQEQVQEYIKLARMNVPQRTSSDTTNFGKFVVETPDPDEEDPDPVDQKRVLLLDVLTYSTKHNPGSPRNIPTFILEDDEYNKLRSVNPPIGARTLWPIDPATGERQLDATSPACRSSNGIDAWRQHKGSEVWDPRLKQMVKIGLRYDRDVPEKSAYSCLTCPLGQFFKDEETGKWMPPPCNQTFEYVLYDVDEDRIFTIRGGNRGLQLALTGHKKKNDRDIALWNGDEIVGIERFFLPMNPSEPHIVPSRPEGMPDRENINRPVYPVLMYPTLNNFDTRATLVPAFVLMDGSVESVKAFGGFTKVPKQPQSADFIKREITVEKQPLTLEELGRWLTARKQYHDEEMRSKLMSEMDIEPRTRVSSISEVDNALLESGKTDPALPSWSASSIEVTDDDDDDDEDDVTEGEVTEA